VILTSCWASPSMRVRHKADLIGVIFPRNRMVELGRPEYVRIIAAVRSTLTSKQPDRLNQAA
jgi:hypothetical protein